MPSDPCLISILRRFDLDADARLNLGEFSDGIKPQALEASKKCHGEKYQSLTASRLTQEILNKSANKTLRKSQSRTSAAKSASKKPRMQSASTTSANKSGRERSALKQSILV